MSPLLIDPVLCFLPLFAAFYLGRDSTDLDFLQRRRKIRVERKRVSWINFPARRMLFQNLEFRACERLKVPLQLAVRDGRGLFNLLEGMSDA